MIIFNDCNIRFLILIIELIFIIRLLFLLFLLFIFLITLILFMFFLFFLQLCLFLQFSNSLSLPDLIISDDSLSHGVIFWIHKFSENFLLFLKFTLEFIIRYLNLRDLVGQNYEIIFEEIFF